MELSVLVCVAPALFFSPFCFFDLPGLFGFDLSIEMVEGAGGDTLAGAAAGDALNVG
jgi:hypothetical protein